jgi:hypothetical protein
MGCRGLFTVIVCTIILLNFCFFPIKFDEEKKFQINKLVKKFFIMKDLLLYSSKVGQNDKLPWLAVNPV